MKLYFQCLPTFMKGSIVSLDAEHCKFNPYINGIFETNIKNYLSA